MQNASCRCFKHTLSLLTALVAMIWASTCAAGAAWRAADSDDLKGIWRQAGVVVMDPKIDSSLPWFTSTQFFWFLPDGKLKHLQVDPDPQPGFEGMPPMLKNVMQKSPAIQTISWHSRGIALLKHPERPQQRIDLGIYLTDADAGPDGGKINPRKGDMIIVFYEYKDPNKPSFYRLLRKVSDE